MAPPPKQTSLLGFFSKAPKPSPSRDPGTDQDAASLPGSTPTASAKTTASTARTASKPTPPKHEASSSPPSATKRKAQNAPPTTTPASPQSSPLPRPAKTPRTKTTEPAAASSLTPPLSSQSQLESSPPVQGRRRAARVQYKEPKLGSDSEESESEGSDDDSDSAHDEFVLSDSDASMGDDDVDSAVESEEPSTASEDEDVDDDEPRPRRAAPAKSQQRSAAPSTPSSLPTPAPAPSRSRAHLTKAEWRIEEEKRKKAENEQAYSFLLDVRDKDMRRPGDLNYDQRTLYIPSSAWKSFTPFEKQFWEIKQNHWDTVLFFQKGKFYELYEEDALIGHRECDLKLTDRVKMKMVGVPEASFDLFATKLLALGYKVGRVDQCETAVAKGMRVGEKSRGGGSEIVRRELRHVVTSGTVVDGHVLSDDLSSYCVSIKERAQPDGTSVLGVCMLDAATAEFRYMTFHDDLVLTQLETLLRSLRVKEVLLEKGVMQAGTMRLVRNTVPSVCQVTLLKPATEFLDEDAARERLSALFPEWPAGLQPLAASGGVALEALGAMLWYLEQLHLDKDLCASANFGERSAPAQSQGRLILDAKSLVHLQVLQNEQGGDEGTLHRLLNRCVTPFGKRLFKLWLAAPLCDVKDIEARFDAVDDLIAHPEWAETFERFAKTLPDLERLQSRVAAGRCRPRDFLLVLRAFQRFRGAQAALSQAVETCSSQLLARLLRDWPDVAALAERLGSHFHAMDDGMFNPVHGEAPAYDDAVTGVEQAEERLEQELRACASELKLSPKDIGWKHIGTNEIYQLEVPARTKVPATWMLMSQTKAAYRYYTPKTRELIRELKEARERRLAALKVFQDDVYRMFRDDLPSYAAAVRTLAQLDALLSLAKSSMALGMPRCRPELIEQNDAMLSFAQLRHPCMGPSVLTGASEFIPNDVALGGDVEEVMVLTGGNMAGKSTTARTAACAVILAQLGCYVPAAHARLAPVDRISSRMGAQDQLFRRQSTFMVEMLEAAKILKEATRRSLVIIDELGRGTSTFDGQAIAYAVLHELVTETQCLGFFMTHYTTMAKNLEGYPRLANKHMEVLVDDEQKNVLFTYRLIPGVAESSYGTQVARIAGVPDTVCDQAQAVSQRFFEEAQARHAQQGHGPVPLGAMADFARLVAIGRGTHTTDTARLNVLARALRCLLPTTLPVGAPSATST